MPPAAAAWTQANAKLRYNRNASTGLSLGVGFMGGEVASIIPIGAGRQLCCMGDTYVATAAGQQGVLGPNAQSSTPSAPRCRLVSNAVLIFDNADLSLASTPTFVTRPNVDGTPGPFWPPAPIGPYPSGQATTRSVVNGVLLDTERLLIGGHRVIPTGPFGFDIAGYWYAIVHHIDDTNPMNWRTEMLPTFIGQPLDRIDLGNCGVVDLGDGYWTFFGAGPGSTWSSARILKADLGASRFARFEWWDGGAGWQRDSPVTGRPCGHRNGRRASLFGFTLAVEHVTSPSVFDLDAFPGFGRVHKRSDGKLQLTGGFFPPIYANTILPQINYSNRPNGNVGTFPAPTKAYDIPESTANGSIYNVTCHPQLTWSAKAADDQVWTYNFNPGADNSDFFPRVLKATGLT